MGDTTLREDQEAVARAAGHETKEISGCMSCPMFVRDYSFCTHWGSPEGNQVGRFESKPPEWCPIRRKPLLLKIQDGR